MIADAFVTTQQRPRRKMALHSRHQPSPALVPTESASPKIVTVIHSAHWSRHDDVSAILAESSLSESQINMVKGVALRGDPLWMESKELGTHWGCRVWGLSFWVVSMTALLRANPKLPRPVGTKLQIL